MRVVQSSEGTVNRRDYPSPDFGAALWPATTFPDGARKEDIQAAMQAAWLADNVALSTEIAKRYGVFGRVCLRCAGDRRWRALIDRRVRR